MNGEQNYWQRSLSSSRVSRRRLLGGAGVAGVGAAGLALVGCGDDDKKSDGTTSTPQGSGTAAPAAIKRDGTLSLRQAAASTGINPTIGLQYLDLLLTPWWEPLWATPLDTGVREGFLAETTEQVDDLHITIKLANSVFHNKPPVNGRAVTSEDVMATFLMMQDKTKTPKMTKDSWWTDVLDKVAAPDAKTVTLTLKSPDSWTFSRAGLQTVPKEHAADPSLMDNDLIGSGLFEFVSHQNGANHKMKRNETYRVKGLPNLAGAQYKLIQEKSAAMAAFSAKEIDGLGGLEKLEKDQLVQKHGKDITIDSDLDRRLWVVVISADGKWADPRIQQAFSMALDRKEMITLLGSGDGQASGPVTPTFSAYALTEKELADTYGKFDPAEAKKLLSAAAFDTSKEYRMPFITLGDEFSSFAQVVQAQLLKNLGVKTKLVGEDLTTWLTKSLYARNFDITPYPTLAYETPNNYVGFYTSTQGGIPNYMGLKSKELDDAYAKQGATYDDKARQELIRDLQKRMWVLGNPMIPTFVKQTNVANWNYVKARDPKKGTYHGFTGKTYIDKG